MTSSSEPDDDDGDDDRDEHEQQGQEAGEDEYKWYSRSFHRCGCCATRLRWRMVGGAPERRAA